MALTQQDKLDIKSIIEGAIDTKVTPQFEEMALMTKHGFDAVDARFDRVDYRLDVLEADVADLKGDMKEVKFKLTDVVHRDEFLTLKQRFDKLEQA